MWTEISYIWPPDATLIKQNARGTAGDNLVNCKRIPRASVYDIPPAPPGDSAGQKIALIATGLKTSVAECVVAFRELWGFSTSGESHTAGLVKLADIYIKWRYITEKRMGSRRE